LKLPDPVNLTTDGVSPFGFVGKVDMQPGMAVDLVFPLSWIRGVDRCFKVGRYLRQWAIKSAICKVNVATAMHVDTLNLKSRNWVRVWD
jgi:hypothetical protein